MTSRPSTAAPILAVLAIVVVTLGAYMGGYFWLGERTEFFFVMDTFSGHNPPRVTRSYSHEWIAAMFQPAGMVEAWWLDGPVVIDGNRDQHL
jgi:hypothetical protein